MIQFEVYKMYKTPLRIINKKLSRFQQKTN